MSLFTNKRAAAIGMAGALALGTVASVGSMTTANGAELATTYTCLLATGPMDLPVTGSLAFPDSVPTGSSLSGLPASMSVTYEYPARGKMSAVKLSWYQGESKPDLWESNDIPQWKDGVLFVGDDGWLLANYQKFQLFPDTRFKGMKLPDPWLPRVKSHHMEFVDACKGTGKTLANFDYAGRLTEANHLGNVAYRVGKKLQWDAEKMVATNAPEAGALIRKERRKGWELPL